MSATEEHPEPRWMEPVLYGVASIFFTILYVWRSHEFYLATLDSLTSLTAARPFQYRVLVPLVVRLVQTAGVAEIRMVYYAITSIALALALHEFRWLLERSLKPRVAIFAALLLLWPLAFNDIVFVEIYYPSDIVALTFFLVAIRFIIERNDRALVLLMIFATLNRETSALIILACLVLNRSELRTRRLIRLLVTLAALWIGVKLSLAFAFRANDGSAFEWHLRDNWGLAKQLMRFDPTMLAYAIFAFGGFHLWSSIVVRRCSDEVRMQYLLALCLVLPMAGIGMMMELRIFHEALVGFTLPVALWLVTKVAPSEVHNSERV